MVYLDGIVIFYKTPGKHVHHTWKVLTLLNNDEGNSKLKKCLFFTKIIDHLRHFIRPRRLEIELHMMEAICGTQKTTNITDLRSFLDLCNVFRRFDPYFVRLAVTLNKKL